MRIPLDDTPFYYLTTPDSHVRHLHFEQAFGKYRPIRVLPVPATDFDTSESHFQRTRKSGITGYLKILDSASRADTHRFRPFVILEDDVKCYREMPTSLELPDNCDLCYLGLSEWGMTNQPNGMCHTVCCTDAGPDVVRVYNMLSTHGMLLTSLRGLLTLQKCLLDDYYKGQGWDRSLAQIQPYIHAYALKEPLVYQYGPLGGMDNERATRITHTRFLHQPLPDAWTNTTNLSIISNADEATVTVARTRPVAPTSPTLDLVAILAALPTYVVLRFDHPAFPAYTPGTDIDLLVADLDASVRAITDLYDASHFAHRVRHVVKDQHAHVDIVTGASTTLQLRFDVYVSLPYKRFHLHPGVYANVLAHRTHNGRVWVPCVADDLALRYAEYVEYKDVRPDKAKHLHHVDQAGVDCVRVQPGARDCTLRYASCETACFGFLVWGHGLSHLDAVFDTLHATMKCQVLHVKRLRPGDLAAFLQVVYAADLGAKATALHGHIKAKTAYLENVPRECVFILVHKLDTRIVNEFDEDIVDVKWSIRKRFNPRSASQPALGRLPQGITHHHVIHGIDRVGECDPICRHITGHPPMHFYQRIARGKVEVPHHVSVTPSCQVHTVPLAGLRANILGRGVVPLVDTPHYAFVTGNEVPYRAYYSQHCGKALTDGHSCACFRRTLATFNPRAYAYHPARYVVVRATGERTWQIVDGVHRSAVLRQWFGAEGQVPCVVL